MGKEGKSVILIIILMIFVGVIPSVETKWVFNSEELSLDSDYLVNMLCPQNVNGGTGTNNYVVFKAQNNNNFQLVNMPPIPIQWPRIEWLFCKGVSSDQNTNMVVVDISSAQDADGTSASQIFSCFNVYPNKPVVCGLGGSPVGQNNNDDAVDRIKCCSVRDVIINTSDTQIIFSDTGGGVDVCPPSRPVMCGAQNEGGSNNKIMAIQCCGIYFEGNLSGSCSDNIDNDNDGYTDCADQDCNGKVGGIISGQPRLCEYLTENNCNDGFDNNRLRGADLADSDCSGEQETQCISAPYFGDWQNGLSSSATATNGNDGCCGNDPLLTAPPFSYDYGDFVYNAAVGNFMCYYSNVDLWRISTYPEPEIDWAWLNSNAEAYKIRTLNKSTTSKTIDIISNSENWFYTGVSVLNGANPINLLETFTTPSGGTGDIQCSEYFSAIFQHTFEFVNHATCPSSIPYCCKQDNNVNVSYPRSQIADCFYDEVCKINGVPIIGDNICDIAPLYFPELCGLNTGGGGSPDFIDKNLCMFNPAVCIDFETFNPNLPCTGQSVPNDYNTVLCSESERCYNGLIYNTNDPSPYEDYGCCIGQGADCVTVITPDDCYFYGGIIFDPQISICMEDILLNNGKHCCLTETVPNIFAGGFYGVTQPEAFIYYKQEGNDYLAECCVDTTSCVNWGIGGTDMDLKYGRVSSAGNSLHTVRNYDYAAASELIIDQVLRRQSLPGNQKQSVSVSGIGKISSFAYLEFDITYNSENGKNLLLLINNVPSVKPISEYSNNGNGVVRWHHIIIPLDYWKNQGITEMFSLEILNPTSDSAGFLLDSVVLTPNPSQYSVNSPNYYCTGGFFSWIDDMDAPPETDFTEVKEYGPYQVVCDSQAAYGWTGENCCGDDTRGYNDGEYFEDIYAGCFAGTRVLEKSTVANAKGIYEISLEFEEYPYKGLMFNNSKFISCQGSTEITLMEVSYNGIDKEGPLLSVPIDVVNKQCQVEGKYYCFNQAWKQSVPGINIFNFFTQQYDPLPTELYLKSSPPGIILVKEGDFGDTQRYTPTP